MQCQCECMMFDVLSAVILLTHLIYSQSRFLMHYKKWVSVTSSHVHLLVLSVIGADIYSYKQQPSGGGSVQIHDLK